MPNAQISRRFGIPPTTCLTTLNPQTITQFLKPRCQRPGWAKPSWSWLSGRSTVSMCWLLNVTGAWNPCPALPIASGRMKRFLFSAAIGTCSGSSICKAVPYVQKNRGMQYSTVFSSDNVDECKNFIRFANSKFLRFIAFAAIDG